MKFPGFTGYKTGVLIPVFSLRTEVSCGSGEFLDLKLLANWCKQSGLDVIQLLPVNDTGDDPSPYNALSAFALHPLYIRPSEIPEIGLLKEDVKKKVEQNISKLRTSQERQERVAYKTVLAAKFQILDQIFAGAIDSVTTDKKLHKWIQENPWVRDYAVFRTLKAVHKNAGWQHWKTEYKYGNQDVVERVWKDKELGQKALFYSWIQFRLEAQFLEAADYLNTQGIMLKGDIPIMMNEDSADVWALSQNFHLDLRAGAPPDMFSKTGQNWGFPIYNWEYLEAHDFDWWRKRLRYADKFYQAYRIDHVLGFFRIWTIEKHHKEGLLGFFKPSIYLSKNDLYGIGFDDGRIRWLSEPHVYGWKIRELFGMRSIEIIGRCFNPIGNEDLFLFKPEIEGERTILDFPIMDDEKQMLIELYRDRALIRVDHGLYSPAWTYRDCGRFQGLGDREKHAFDELVSKRGSESEQLWKKNGHKLLKFMMQTVPMLTCAEDLGVIPSCVPVTLHELGILSLKIPRWARIWDQQGQPYYKVENYPFLSVCAPSVHDTSTLRDWWENEEDKWGFWSAMEFQGSCPPIYGTDVATLVISKLLNANSALCLFQIQDLFALEDRFRVQDSRKERINIPGTVQESNWSYRIPMSLEDLNRDNAFSGKIADMVAPRKSRPLPT